MSNKKFGAILVIAKSSVYGIGVLKVYTISVSSSVRVTSEIKTSLRPGAAASTLYNHFHSFNTSALTMLVSFSFGQYLNSTADPSQSLLLVISFFSAS